MKKKKLAWKNLKEKLKSCQVKEDLNSPGTKDMKKKKLAWKNLKEKLKSCQVKEDQYTSFLTYRIFSFSNGVNKSARNFVILFLPSHLQNKCLLIISLINNHS